MRQILSSLFSLIFLLTTPACTHVVKQPIPVDPPGSNSDGSTSSKSESALPYDGVYPQHEPYGAGIGAMPGRVVWTHDPDSVDWDGEGYWWQLDHFDEAAGSLQWGLHLQRICLPRPGGH